MLNLNNTPVGDNTNQEFTLIPNGTVARAIIIVKGGDIELPEFGSGQWFKASQSSSAKWMELEFTIVGGMFDRRKFWDRVFVDGDKIGNSGMPLAKEIGLRTMRNIIESANNLDPSDMSDAAQQRRNISGVFDLNAMEICAKIGIKKGTNGYSDQNKLLAALTPNQKEFVPSGQPVIQQTPMANNFASNPQPAPVQTQGGPVPAWASR
jgi:hypothetical protein